MVKENGEQSQCYLVQKTDSSGVTTVMLSKKGCTDIDETFITYADTTGMPDFLVHKQVCYTLVDSMGSTWVVGYDSLCNQIYNIKVDRKTMNNIPFRQISTRGVDAGDMVDVFNYTKIILDNAFQSENPSDLQNLFTDLLGEIANGAIVGSLKLPTGLSLPAGQVIAWIPDALLYARGIFAFGNCYPEISGVSLSNIDISLVKAHTLGKDAYSTYAIIRKGEDARLDFDYWDYQSSHANVIASSSNVKVSNPLNNSNLYNTIGKFTIRPVLYNIKSFNIPIRAFRVGSYRLGNEGTFQLPQSIELKNGTKKSAKLNNDGYVDCNVDFQLATSPALPFKYEALLYITTAEGKFVDSETYVVDNGNFTINWQSGIPASVFKKDCTQTFKAKVFLGENNEIESDSTEFTLSYQPMGCPDDNHPHAIDLGLPSGTKWCCMNVGASTPEGYGGYYAWGETSTKSVYNWDTYAYYNDNMGIINIGSDIAGTSYDAATVNMGSPWRMPSCDQQVELINNCSRQWTTINGVNGILVTGTNGGQIFLPAAGHRWDGYLGDEGSGGYYWSSSLDPNHANFAYSLGFDSGYWNWGYGYYYRDFGQSVRAVRP